MEKWRELAVQVFPERQTLYKEDSETVWQVIFDIRDAILEAHRAGDTDQLKKLYGYAAWCYTQKDIEPEVWTAAWCGFYEHLVEEEVTYRAIPKWVQPDIFRAMVPEFTDRLENFMRYPGPKPGSMVELLESFDAENGTNFAPGP